MGIKLPGLLISGIGFLILAALVGGLAFGIISLIRLFIKIKKLDHPEIIKYYFFMIACILIMAASWILNMGWFRIILTWLAFPVIHAVLFMVINGKAMLKLFLSKRLKAYTLLSFLTYIIAYVSLPDFGDRGPSYVFFGLLRNGTVAGISIYLCLAGCAAHIAVSILQLIELGRLKKAAVPPLQENIPTEDI